MNIGIIIAGSIVFALVFIYLGYRIGVNIEKNTIMPTSVITGDSPKMIKPAVAAIPFPPLNPM